LRSLFRSRAAGWSARAVAAAIVGLVAWAFWLEPSSLVVVEQHLFLPFTRPGTVRVAVLADLHVGSPFNGISNLRRVVERTNAAQPELVCILGDLVVQGVRGGRFVDPESIAAELAKLRPPLGVFAVLGNHDDWLDHDRVARALTERGIRVIEETAIRIDTAGGPLWLAGISDLWMGNHDIAKALAKVSDDAPVILLTHNPDVFPSVPPRVALTLAGHTHGGQVRLPFFGAPIVPSQFGQRFAAGLVRESDRQMFVTTGVGTSILPVRFRVPPSIALLTLQRH